MNELTTDELQRLIERVFRPGASDDTLAFLVDLPDDQVPDNDDWAARREMVVDWWQRLRSEPPPAVQRIDLVFFRNAHRNNAELPSDAIVHREGAMPVSVDRAEGARTSFEEIFRDTRMLIAATEFSATAPLKVHARQYGFRAATMPGFRHDMIPALRLDYTQIDRRCRELKALLDEALSARLRFEVEGDEHVLSLDLRHRTAHASGGLVTQPGTAGNLPSGETYIVPYEGEIEGDPSRTQGTLPLQLEGEVLYYRIRENKVCEVVGSGPAAAAERLELQREPAYGNVAELGLGVLADYGIRAVGELLLDEKLGLHVAFGRSDHFGGQVGASDFSAPDRVVHIDRVYIPEVQPRVSARAVDLELPSATLPLMRDGRYVGLDVD